MPKTSVPISIQKWFRNVAREPIACCAVDERVTSRKTPGANMSDSPKITKPDVSPANVIRNATRMVDHVFLATAATTEAEGAQACHVCQEQIVCVGMIE
jgi:hypothetical protein